MVINCNNEEEILKIINDKEKSICFPRGSRVYGTHNEKSDYDFGYIVPDNTEFIDIEGAFDNEKSDNRIHNSIDIIFEDGVIGCQFIKESDFINMIKEQQPFALEAISYGKQNNMRVYWMYKDFFTQNNWILRKTVSAIVNNSWAKAHKKLTVEKDFDQYCGYKSLFHSIRLQEFACQIATYGEITNFNSCNNLWNDLKNDMDMNKDWDYLKEKYKPIYNEMHSKLVQLCPKPEEEFKKG